MTQPSKEEPFPIVIPASISMPATNSSSVSPFAKKTLREGVLSGLGGFGALFEVPKRYREPVLVPERTVLEPS